MKMHLVISLVVVFLSVQITRAELISSTGLHPFPDSNVVVSITETKPDEINFTMTFDLPSRSKTGTGKGSPMKMAPGRWAAQFVAPNQLWIFDGLVKVALYERTIDPRGFKASDSSVVTSLLTDAPEELRLFMAKQVPTSETPTKE